MTLTRAAEAAILAGSYDTSATYAVELLALLRDQASHRWFADALEIVALIVANRGDDDLADECFRTAETLRHASGETTGGVRSLTPMVQRLRERLDAKRPAIVSNTHPDVAIGRAHAALTTRPDSSTSALAAQPLTGAAAT